MGAKHPQETIAQLGANKIHFILAARHLIRQGIVKTPGDAIRYMEKNNSDVEAIIEEFVVSKQTKLVVEEPETVDE
tara:strand:- start:7915 stop:8142 length:228 start_codon:yes stop_codon:yes gene_type:complete